LSHRALLLLKAAALAAGLAALAPAQAAVTATFSAGTACGGATSANFQTAGTPVKVSLCVTTTTEAVCGATVQLRSASAAEDGRFFVTARTLPGAFSDANAASLTFPVAVSNPPPDVDLGGTTSATTPVAAGASILLGTFDLAPQAGATNSAYVLSLGGFSALASEPSNCLSGAAVDVPLAASFTLNRIAAPVITSASSATFIVAQANSFTITATGSPTPSITVSGAPSGITFNSATGVLGGTPALGTVGVYTVTIKATNTAGTDTRFLTLTVIKADQAITFSAPPDQPFTPAPIPLTATASSGLTVALASTTPSVCTVSGTTLTMLAAGTCTIQASQAGSANYNPAPTLTQSFNIAATAPSAPTITAAAPANLAAVISFNPPANYGGAAITSYTATCNPGAFTATSAGSPIVVSGLANGTAYDCSVTATNASGTSPPSGTLSVTPTSAPTAPTIASPNTTTFTVTQAGTFTVVGTGNPAPTLSMIGTLPGGVTFTAASGVLAGAPALGSVGTYPLKFTATNPSGAASQPFTLVVAKAGQAITFAGPPNQSFSATPIALSATATSGLTVSFASTTLSVCTVSGSSLTMVTAGLCTVVASQAGNANYSAAAPVTRSFTIGVALPGAPSLTSVARFSGGALAYFVPPASNGGTPITGYTVTCNPGAITAAGTTSPIKVNALANGTTYACSVTATNANGTGPPSNVVNVTPGLVTTFSGPSATGTGVVSATFTGGGATCSFTSARFIPLSGDPASPPAGSSPSGVSFPHGLFDFTLGGCTPGSTITMSIAYPSRLPAGAVYWKYGPTPSDPASRWYILRSTVNADTIKFTITDGGLGDDDRAADGTIVDAGGPGVGTGGSNIPALDPWMLLVLAGILLFFGLRRLQ
jgi:hypothetical protein